MSLEHTLSRLRHQQPLCCVAGQWQPSAGRQQPQQCKLQWHCAAVMFCLAITHLLVLGSILLSLAHHALDLVIRQAAATCDADGLLLGSGLRARGGAATQQCWQGSPLTTEQQEPGARSAASTAEGVPSSSGGRGGTLISSMQSFSRSCSSRAWGDRACPAAADSAATRTQRTEHNTT